jgi:hypothetical protein
MRALPTQHKLDFLGQRTWHSDWLTRFRTGNKVGADP